MDIIFATNNKFCPFSAVAIVSLLENNKEEDITIHLFTIECEQFNVDNVTHIVERYKKKCIIHDIKDDIFQKLPYTGIYSTACYLRLFTPSLLPNADKALYLDCDLIINGNLKELFDTNIDGFAVAAVRDATLSYNIVKDYLGFDYWKDGYFNSGVLLMNLKFWRERNLQNLLFSYLSSHRVSLPDQDALNIILHGYVLWLHPKWNCHTGYFSFPPLVVEKERPYIKQLWTDAKIIHFTGPNKPWLAECVNPYKRMFYKYREMTGLRYEEAHARQTGFRNCLLIILRHCKNLVARLVSYIY